MGFSGNKFTWSNNRRGAGYIVARLDRALCNHQRHSSATDPLPSQLPKLSSDHCPLLLSHNLHLLHVNTPFKFDAMWIQDPDFLKIVEDNWNSGITGSSQFILAQNLKNMKQFLKAWNRNVFGDINLKVQAVGKNIQLCQDLLDAGPSDSLFQDLSDAKSLHNWLQTKESHRRQKSRIRWLNEGDSNAAFFHAYTKSRGAVNRIDKILFEGQLEPILPLQLLPTPAPADSLFDINSIKVSTDKNFNLSIIPDVQQIKTAIFAQKKDSSPGPDGFSGAFFTATWSITGYSVVKAVCHFFSSGKLYKVSNRYFLTLIPKIQSPSSFSDFRPISLLNFSYKILAKILASGLSQIIPSSFLRTMHLLLKGDSYTNTFPWLMNSSKDCIQSSVEALCACNWMFQKLLISLTRTFSSTLLLSLASRRSG
ncbi:hypothetical protein AAC387_Pa08g0946 [Persea americana]